jgi:hypothetical protein
MLRTVLLTTDRDTCDRIGSHNFQLCAWATCTLKTKAAERLSARLPLHKENACLSLIHRTDNRRGTYVPPLTGR